MTGTTGYRQGVWHDEDGEPHTWESAEREAERSRRDAERECEAEGLPVRFCGCGSGDRTPGGLCRKCGLFAGREQPAGSCPREHAWTVFESGRQSWPAASRDQAVTALRKAGLHRSYLLAVHPDGAICRAEALACEDDASGSTREAGL